MTGPKIEAVIVTYNSAMHIRPCLQSLRLTSARTIVVDNGSQDGTVEMVRSEFPEVKVIQAGQNVGYATALNVGVKETSSSFVLAANPDTIFLENSLQTLADFLNNTPRAGMAGPQQFFPDGAWQRSYGDVQGISEGIKALMGITSVKNVIRRRLSAHLHGRPRSVGYVDGAVMMIRRAAFDEIDGFDNDFHYYCEDADFGLRMRQAGWAVYTVPSSRVVHVRGGSSTKVEGYSERLLTIQANAYCQLIRKHHSSLYLRFYRLICSLHARKMQFIYRLLQASPFKRHAPRATTMAATFRCWARIWAEMKS